MTFLRPFWRLSEGDLNLIRFNAVITIDRCVGRNDENLRRHKRVVAVVAFDAVVVIVRRIAFAHIHEIGSELAKVASNCMEVPRLDWVEADFKSLQCGHGRKVVSLHWIDVFDVLIAQMLNEI